MQVNTKTFVLSFVATFAAMFALSLLVYSLVLGKTITSRIDPAFLREPPGYCCIILGYVALAVPRNIKANATPDRRNPPLSLDVPNKTRQKQ